MKKRIILITAVLSCLLLTVFAVNSDITGFTTFSMWQQVETIKDIAGNSTIDAMSYCNHIAITSKRDRCYYTISDVKKDASYCNLIRGQDLKDRCYTRNAEYMNNSLMCRAVSEGSRRDNCYMGMLSVGDYSICQNIINKYFRETCMAMEIMSDIPDYSGYKAPLEEQIIIAS